MDISLVYVTTPDLATAKILAEQLIHRKLCACANIFEGMKSIYPWEGEIQRSQESAMLLKTTKSLFASLKEAIEELHPYDTPCVLEIPIERAAESYRDWLVESTS